MPIRLPMRRRAGPTAEPPFRRRTPPTPQATRLMRLSLAAGLLFLAVLGAVFIPQALRYNDVAPPVISFTVSGANPFVVTVAAASRAYPLGEYTGELNVSRAGSPSVSVFLSPDLTVGAWGNVSFVDADANGALSVGDQFRVSPEPGTGWTYELLIFWKPRCAGLPSPCPYAAGRVEWTP